MEKAISGFSAQTIIKLSGNVLALVKMMVLARLLGPNEYGLYSLILIALGLSESITQTGVNLTILQSKQSVSYFINTAWVIAIFRGFIISLMMIGLGWGMQAYFQISELFFLITIASLVPAIKGFINPAIVGMHKSLSFWTDGLYRFSLIAAETIFSIAIVWWFRSVTAWIVALVATAIFEVTISFLFFKLKPRFEYLSSRAEIIFNNAKWMSLSSIFSYLSENLDNLIIGKVINTYSLGLYQNSYSFCHEANFEIAKSIHHGTLPVYTRLVSEPARLRSAVLKTMVVGSLAVTVLSLPLFIAPHFFINLLFGEKWLEAVPTIRVMLIAGIIHSWSMLCYTVWYAKNLLKNVNFHLGMTVVLMLIFMPWLGTHYGLVGAVWGLVLSRLLPLPYAFLCTKQTIHVNKK